MPIIYVNPNKQVNMGMQPNIQQGGYNPNMGYQNMHNLPKQQMHKKQQPQQISVQPVDESSQVEDAAAQVYELIEERYPEYVEL